MSLLIKVFLVISLVFNGLLFYAFSVGVDEVINKNHIRYYEANIRHIQSIFEQIDENGVEYARRALVIYQHLQIVRLEKHIEETGAEKPKSVKNLLIEVSAYHKKNNNVVEVD